MNEARVLLIEDDEAFRQSLAAMVVRLGYDVVEAESVKEARQVLADAEPDIVILDLGLPDGNGLELRLDDGLDTQTPFIVVSGDASTSAVRDALKSGATDYLTKPVDPVQLRTVLHGLQQGQHLRREIDQLQGELRKAGRFGALVGRSGPMQRVYELIARVAPTDAPVLVTGESGSGKEVVAQTLHQRSRRADGPFIALNCGALPESLIESALFGHEKGSFTGANEQKKGVFEEAHGGTLFLDEIGEMPADLQVRLLRVLETRQITRVGASDVVDVDVRVVAATNRDPQQAVAEGRMREDLFFRLNVFPIHLPPLRDRGDDVLLLADHFLDELNERHGITKHFERQVRAKVLSSPWPGNVRQLRNAIERAWIMTDAELQPDELDVPSGELEGGAPAAPASSGGEVRIAVGTTIADAERRIIEATLAHCGGNKRKVARVLGISVKTLYNRLNSYEATEPIAS